VYKPLVVIMFYFTSCIIKYVPSLITAEMPVDWMLLCMLHVQFVVKA